ncbi:MAG: hypothetical protein WCR94_02535, partial [Bacteroides graminisolvens]
MDKDNTFMPDNKIYCRPVEISKAKKGLSYFQDSPSLCYTSLNNFGYSNTEYIKCRLALSLYQQLHANRQR